jgi:serine/threonine protein kinase/Tol biopolymer transport system component
MPDDPGTSANLDVFLGKMAVDWGLITPDQLRFTLSEQSRDIEEGRPTVRRLGEILVANGFITKNQLDALLVDQRSKTGDPTLAIGQDMRLGQHLVQKGVISQRQLNECLRLQAEALEAGRHPLPSLGDLLVDKKYVKADDLRRVVDGQQRATLVCVICSKRYPVTGFDPTKAYRCRECKGDLVSTVGMMSGPDDESGLILPFSDIAPPVRGTPSSRNPVPVSGSAAAVVPAPVPYGKYLLMREIGRGGMAVVYEAKDTTLDRKVALKMMIDNPFLDPAESAQDEERFLREARFCASISKHPSIVGVYEAGVMEGKRYIVMEYIEGYPMSRWRRMGSLSVRQQVAMLRDVALAVHYAHENGVIHRDLKPQNVLVDEERRPHVTDFGLAKAINSDVSASLTAPRMTVGTPQYMSPEQAKGLKTVDRRTDIWSLGVMLYEMLTGRPPFTGVTPIEILMKVVNNAVPPPSQILRGGHPALDKSIETICMKTLAKDPRDRYATSRAFAEDLSRWLKGEEVKPVEPAGFRLPHVEIPPWVLRFSPFVAALTLLVLLLWVFAGSSSAPSLERELAMAEKLLREGDYRTAYLDYTRILGFFPDSSEALKGKQRAKDKLEEAERLDHSRIETAVREDLEARYQDRIDKLSRDLEEARHKVDETRRQIDSFVGRPYLTLTGHSNSILCAAFARDGRTLATGSYDNSIRVWDVVTGHTLKTLNGHTNGAMTVAFSPDGASLVSGGGDWSVRVWDVATGATRLTLTGHTNVVTAVAWSPDGNTLASASVDRTIRLWNAASGQSMTTLSGHTGPVWALAFSPDGKVLASASYDKTIRLWDLSTATVTRILDKHTASVLSVAFHPKGGTLASGGEDRMVMIWNTATGEDLKTLPGHSDHVRSVAFSPDGKLLASGSKDKSIKLWEASSGSAMRTLLNHTGGVRALAFNNDGSVLASGAGDIRIEPDGRILVSAGGVIDTSIRCWGSK